MLTPSVKGYMPLCVTPRSLVCDEQGIGDWPMWKRFDSVKGIVDQYIDEPYRDFLARPEYDVDKQKPEEYFYWFTPRSENTFTRLSHSGDDHDYYKDLLDKTISHYHSVIEKLKHEGKVEEANFLQLSMKYAGDSEDNVYCGNGRVVAAVWGMKPRAGHDMGDSKLVTDLFPPKELHTVQFNLDSHGATENPTILKKGHGTKIFAHQIPQVTAVGDYTFVGWDRSPLGVEVNGDLIFTAQYIQKPKEETPKDNSPKGKTPPQTNHVRFLSPDGEVIKELDVKHGKRILPGDVPQLPAVNGILCSAWDGDPLNDIIDSDRDFKAIPPESPEKKMHTVRFLDPDGNVLSQFQVEHDTQLTSDQVPPLPVIDGLTSSGWNEDPLKSKITSDKDFIAKRPRKKCFAWWGFGGCLSALLRWLLLALGLLLLFLLLWCFIFGKCNLNLCGDDCGCDCGNQKELPDPGPEPSPEPEPEPGPRPVPHTGDVQILLSWSNYNDLDIACIDPYGEIVWFQNKSVSSGGILDIDMNNGRNSRRDPIENIYWPTGGAPKGQYKVILTYYARRDNSELKTPYSVMVKHGEEVQTYTGTMTSVNQQVTICTFTIE